VRKNLFNNRLDEASRVLAGQQHKKIRFNTTGETWLWIGSCLLSLIFVIVISKIIAFWNYQPTPKKINRPIATKTEPAIIEVLPGSQEISTSSNVKIDPDFQADKLIFSQIYQAPTSSYSLDILANRGQVPLLPVNIKSEAVNYHEVKRHYNLEPLINNLNQQGSAIVANPFESAEQDFFAFYQAAKNDKWPLILTTDFLFYYYQNNVKEVYKSLEGGFYDSLWQISNSLFELSNRRYQNLLRQGVAGNDPILEAYRLNTQYWAVALKLLVPKENQIKQDNLSVSTIVFRKGDDQLYKMPALSTDLAREVDQEVALINKAKTKELSPLFGQSFDYNFFKPAADYQSGGRLANFYLASLWLRRPWPINYRDQNCQQCSLDKDDWRINFLAANILARDLSSDQGFKNYWAKIYKTMSFFSGLRNELSYVHYVDAQKNILKEQTIEQAIAQDKDWEINVLDKIQAQINKNNFPSSEGGFDRRDSKQQPNIGLRVLQDGYWPGQQLAWSQIYPKLDSYIANQEAKDWQTNQFWSSVATLKTWLAKTLAVDQKWNRPNWWRGQQLATAKFYLINWLLPFDQVANSLLGGNLTQNGNQNDVLISLDTNALPAIDNQVATAKMLKTALIKLQINNSISEQKLLEVIDNLTIIRDLAIKQANGQVFSQEEIVWLNTFLQRNVLQAGSKNLINYFDNKPLQVLQSRIEVRNYGGQPNLFIGPILKP